MKKTLLVVMLGLIIFSGVVSANSDELNILVWDKYYTPEVIDGFSEKYDAEVKVTEYSTYGEMLEQINDHDLVVTGELIYPTLINQGLLDTFDKSKLTAFKNLDPLFKGLAFDPQNNYSIPYHYIYVGLVYHKDRIKRSEVSLQNYFEAPEKFKGRLTTFPNKRIMVGYAMIYMGHSMNNLESENLEFAKMLIENLKGNLSEEGKKMDRGVLSPYQELLDGKADIAISYAAESTRKTMNAKEEIGVVLPKEGSIIGTDNISIPKTADNKELAYKFINYLYTPEVAVKSVNYLGNPIPIIGVKDEIDPELAKNPNVYPPSENAKNFQFFIPMTDEQLAKYDKLWAEVFGE